MASGEKVLILETNIIEPCCEVNLLYLLIFYCFSHTVFDRQRRGLATSTTPVNPIVTYCSELGSLKQDRGLSTGETFQYIL